MRYAIADYLTQEQCDRAALADYIVIDGGTRTDHAVCPLSVAFCLGYSPDADEVAEILAMAGGYAYVDALEAANSFISDVDSGLIGPDQVAEALGVTTAAPDQQQQRD